MRAICTVRSAHAVKQNMGQPINLQNFSVSIDSIFGAKLLLHHHLSISNIYYLVTAD